MRPTKENIADLVRDMGAKKFNKEHTSDFTTQELNEIWEELIKAISEITGVFIPFPSQEETEEYLQSYEKQNPKN